MHVLVATDGSKQSLQSATYLRHVVDADSVTKVSVVAVVSPLAAVPFAAEGSADGGVELSFRREAEQATLKVAEALDGWGPPVSTHVYSGAPANEIIKAAKRFDSGLIVLASQSTRTQAVLMGSVSHKVLNQATCPVLVHRPGPKPARKPVRRSAKKA
ncbi:MAG: universal stress protein [Propionibacteriales bacterium]|nr:universal stress protein [Propionibacteriales bacterium]